jgi:hypothetical protein
VQRPVPLAVATLGAALALGVTSTSSREATRPAQDEPLARLFADFVAAERPPLKDGAPDYSPAANASRAARLESLKRRHEGIDSSTWPVRQQVDYALVGALLAGFDFDLRVLRPWARDPAYYKSIWMAQSDTPAHEGPTHHAVVEVWTYRFPLSPADETRLAAELASIPPLLAQARENLTGNARDLWVTGTGTMAQQVADLEALGARVPRAGAALAGALDAARTSTRDFVAWLTQQAPSKTGPSGIGKADYTWALQHVHLVPMTWEDEVQLLERELARAHASLTLEEHRNRHLPPLTAVTNAEEFRRRADAGASKFMAFLKDKEILTVAPYLEPALREHLGVFVPLERRNFFAIATHYEPVTLYTHFYHWFDHAWMRNAPSESAIRRGATHFNVWDSRAEGLATAFEEIVLHAGYYDDNPRAREIVWIMLAQRAARGLASLRAQANEFDMAAAKAFQVEWTPRGWMRPDLDLLGFEQQLYLRQPGYGTSYVTGKYLVDDLIRARARQLGDRFTVRRFFDELNASGLIPVSLIHWEMTGGRAR